MAYLILPRRTRQPQGAVRISPTSQFLPGLRFSMPHPAVGDIVNGNQLTLGAGGSRVATAQGIAIAGNGSQACATIPLNLSGSYVMSASFWLKWDTFANDDKLAFELTSNTNSNVGGLLLDPNAAAGTLQLYGLRSAGNGGGWECSRPSPGLHHYVVTLRQDVSYAVPGRIWIDGVEQTASRVIATTASFTAFANSTLYLMSRGGTSLFGAGAITGLTFWNDYFDEVKAKELYRYGGWSLYAPDPRRLYYGVSGGAGATTWTYAGTGGVTIAGTAPVLRTKVHTPSGGVALAGAAATESKHAYVYTPGGGLTVAGTAPVLRGKVYAPSGGIAISGTAPLLKGKVYGVSGGVTLAGAAVTSYGVAGANSYPYLPSGGIALAGTAASAATKFYVAPVSGGIVLAGTAASSYTSTAATDYEFLPTGGIAFVGVAAVEGPGGMGGRTLLPRRRKRYLIRDRVYDDLDPADVIAAAKEAGVDLGEVREVTKEPTAQKKAPRHADDDGREYWLPQEFWGRAAKRQKVDATSPLAAEFYRALEALRAPQGAMQQQMALRRRQEEEAILLLTM